MENTKIKRLIKGFLCVLTALIISFSCLPFESFAATTVRTKKVVSIVYDDSGSMMGADNYRWCYANYAVQSLTAMMNKEDSLYITYMYNSVPKEISLKNKEAEVEKIRNHSKGSGTPFKAVEKAFEKLKNHTDKNKNTQFWLVVMTDGQFDGKLVSQVEKELVKYADTKMSNGTKPEIVFFTMCDTGKEFTPQKGLKSNIDVRSADVADDIIGAVSDIADRISGRYAAPDADITVVDEKTVKVTSKLPLRTIGVLTQKSTAKVKKADLNGKAGVIESNIAVKYPEPSGITVAKDKSMKGNVALINNGTENIPAGTYTITFSKEISKENLKILFEPAFELRLEIIMESNVLSDFKKIPMESVLTAKAVLYEAGTNNVIDISLLPGEVSKTVSHLENKKVINSVKGDTLADVKISDKPTSFEAVFELTGFFSLYQSISFVPVRLEVTALRAELFYDGSKRYGNDPERVIYTHDLRKNGTGIKFFMEIDGVPATKDDAIAILPEFKAGIDSKLDNLNYKVGDDGSILVYPTKTVLYPSTLYWIKWHGVQKITESIDKVSAYGEIEIKPGWDILIELWILWIIIRIILMTIYRKKFNNMKIKSSVLPGNANGVRGATLNPFNNCEEITTNLLRFDRGIRTILYLIPPIPGLLLPLLWPASVSIEGTPFKAVANSRSRKITEFKIVSSEKFNCKTGDVMISTELPDIPGAVDIISSQMLNLEGDKKDKKVKKSKKDKKKDNQRVITGEGVYIFALQDNRYIRLKIENIDKTNTGRK